MATLTDSLSIQKNTQLCNVSFSSYLNQSEEAFLRKLVESSKIPGSSITKNQENLCIGKIKVEDGEIGVFGAEKYFKEGIDEENIDYQRTENRLVNISPGKVKTQVRTPSVRSGSSLNSQSGLLQRARESSSQRGKDRTRRGKSLLSTLGCNCSCGDKNSVDIDDYSRESFTKRDAREEIDLDRMNKSRINLQIMEEMQMKKVDDLGIGLTKEEFFTFPNVNLKPGKVVTKVVYQEEEADKKGKSLEVFGSPIIEKRKGPISLERKLNLFTIDTNPSGGQIEFPPSSDGILDDLESDASSDLFEIESFSTTNNSNPFLLRQASNASGCMTPMTCYAPSEASIEWSVVTASAADFSIASDSDYPKSSSGATENARKMNSNGKGKESDKRRSGILSGCQSLKAARVVGDAYKVNSRAVSRLRTQLTPEPFPDSRFKGRNPIFGVPFRTTERA